MKRAGTICRRFARVLLEVGAPALITFGILIGGSVMIASAIRIDNNGHWSTNGHPNAYVTAIDQTGTKWPVFRSQINWNKANNIAAQYVSSGSQCSSHCVDVDNKPPSEIDEFDAACTVGGKAAFGDAQVGQNNHFNTTVKVRFNTACNDINPNRRGRIACHELGHVLGLAHHQSGHLETCMGPFGDNRVEKPSDNNLEELAQDIYDHTG